MKLKQDSTHLTLALLILLAGLVASRPAAAEHTKNRARVQAALQHIPLYFEANQGQTDRRVQFLARGHGYTLFLTPQEAVIVLQKAQGESERRREGHRSKPQPRSSSSVMRMKLLGANPFHKASGQEKLLGQVNYFIGNDPKQWRTHLPIYQKVCYQCVYPGIDLVYYGNQQQLEYDFVVQPGANPKKIALSIGGAKSARVDKSGELVLQTSAGEVRWHKPLVYQQVNGKRKSIAARYTLLPSATKRRTSHQIGFQVAKYDRTKPLVIDPTLAYSTYLRGSGNIAVDSAGYVYVTGTTDASDFPTRNAYQAEQKGDSDVFVMKLDTTQTGAAQLLYATYLGGSDEHYSEAVYGIAVDGAGCVYVTGTTDASDFPIRNAYQENYLGRYGSAFMTKLDTTKFGDASLVYSTYLGGSEGEEGDDIAVDAAGCVYVTGQTISTDFPTRNPFQAALESEAIGSAFVTKLDTTQSGDASLLYSTYLGGSWYELGYGIAVDAAGYIYVTGTTDSWYFPTRNGYQRYNQGHSDTFVTKLDPTQSGTAQLLYSTLLGGDGDDGGYGLDIAVDGAGCAYVEGWTQSSNFPTKNAYQSQNRGYFDAFVTKLDTTQSGTASLLYSTYLGGFWNDRADGIAVDSVGHVYVTGWTRSGDFPKKNAYQGALKGVYDVFVTKLDTTQSGTASLLYSTYLGGRDDEGGRDIAMDAAGYVYLTGWTYSSDFPIWNAYQEHNQGYPGTFVTKLDIRPVTLSGIVTLEGCLHSRGVPLTLRFRPTDGGDAFTVTTTLAADGAFSVSHVPANTYTLAIKGSKWLQKVVWVNATNGNVNPISALLPAGDANDDNLVDVQDLAAFIAAFDAEPASPNWHNGRADFDCNDIVDVDDLALFIRNFDLSGDP